MLNIFFPIKEEKGAGLFQNNLLIGVAIYAKEIELNAANLEIVVFEKVGINIGSFPSTSETAGSN